ncbi:methylenetetrahydrofolate reductase [Agathobacter rectalis]|uniref:methylenetetrahydrofolate reductase n=1 Tax=Agathobacter rectalis TaxID=39491 RepID=UPI0027D26CF8|nr:methylenetetrahydrofolate reductase [Agathobacter rectalis]
MKITQIHTNKPQSLSFEIFPPKKEEDFKNIDEMLEILCDCHPEYISVTFGASDLIKYIKETTGDQFCIAGACYPDIHPEAADKVDDIKNLKKKVDAGAELLLSQLFFDNDTFFNFAEDCRLAGINVPVIPGIMPCINAAQIQRMVTMCGAKFPEKFQKIVHRYGDNKAALFDAGMSYCESQIIELLANDVEGIHLYTMNNVRVAKRLTEGIKNLI